MTPRMIPGVARRKMAEVFTTAVSRQFLLIGSFSLNYLLDPKSETPPPIGQVRLGGVTECWNPPASRIVDPTWQGHSLGFRVQKSSRPCGNTVCRGAGLS